MKHKVVKLIQTLLKKYPIIDLGQKNPNSISRQISLSLVDPCNGLLALDAGCREGFQTDILKGRGYKVISVDIVKLSPETQLVNLNESLPFKENSFDLIYCSEVLEHLVDPCFTVEEFNRVLKPFGKMIITTPNSYCLIFKFLSFLGFHPNIIQKKDHVQFFSINDIRRLFPLSEIWGFFPFFLKIKIIKNVSSISPSFIIRARKNIRSN